MDKHFYAGYEYVKNNLVYIKSSTEDLFALTRIFLKEYRENANTYAFGQCKGIVEILSERISLKRKGVA